MNAYDTYSDQELASLLKQSDSSVFTELYNRYWDKLYVTARKRLDDELEAEEVVQDIFSNLWRKRENFNLDKGFSNYFAVAVKFEVINRLHKRVKDRAFQTQYAGDRTEADESTVQLLDYNELKRQLEETIKALPEKCQIVFKLRHEEGRTQKQIAEELDISEKTVEAHLAKAKKSIRKSFGNLSSLIFLLFL